MDIKVTPISEEYNFNVEITDSNKQTIKAVAILKVEGDSPFFHVIPRSDIKIPQENISQLQEFIMDTYFPITQK